jgi:hypothetical protein
VRRDRRLYDVDDSLQMLLQTREGYVFAEYRTQQRRELWFEFTSEAKEWALKRNLRYSDTDEHPGELRIEPREYESDCDSLAAYVASRQRANLVDAAWREREREKRKRVKMMGES